MLDHRRSSCGTCERRQSLLRLGARVPAEQMSQTSAALGGRSDRAGGRFPQTVEYNQQWPGIHVKVIDIIYILYLHPSWLGMHQLLATEDTHWTNTGPTLDRCRVLTTLWGHTLDQHHTELRQLEVD